MFGPARRPMHLGYVVCCVRYENLVFRTRESRDSCGSSLHLFVAPIMDMAHHYTACGHPRSTVTSVPGVRPSEITALVKCI
jgi:hypothetical protein